MTGSPLLNNLIVILFAAAIVALGANELAHKYARGRPGSTRDGQRMVRELHGPVDVKDAAQGRASLRRGAAAGEAASGGSGSASNDALDRSDRSALKDLLDSVVPL